MWTPHKCRRRGRPKKRWRDELDGFLKDWIVKAGEKTIWKNIEETFTQQSDRNGKKKRNPKAWMYFLFDDDASFYNTCIIRGVQ